MSNLTNIPTTELLAELARREDPLDTLVWDLQAMRRLRLLQEAGYTITPTTIYTTTRYIVPETTG